MTIRRVALYVLAEDPEPRLIEMRRIAREHGWIVTGEYVDAITPQYRLADKRVELQPGEQFRACSEADHARVHDAMLSWAGNLRDRPRLILNRHVSDATAARQ